MAYQHAGSRDIVDNWQLPESPREPTNLPEDEQPSISHDEGTRGFSPPINYTHSNNEGGDAKGDRTTQWQPGFWKRFPVLGLSSLLGVILMTAAMVIVLAVSDNMPIESWANNTHSSGIQPTVFLAVTSVIGNLLLSYALAQASSINFWYGAQRASEVSALGPKA